jgi:hypothetical protein
VFYGKKEKRKHAPIFTDAVTERQKVFQDDQGGFWWIKQTI